jgi:hypothetical protein
MPKTLEGTRRSFPKEDVLLEHIASTYFAKKSRPKTRAKPEISPLKSATLLFVAAGLLAAATGTILIITSISSNNYNEFLRKKISALKTIPVVDKGIVNRDAIKRPEFLGYARQGISKTAKETLILRNPKKYNWAEVLLPFRFPIDLSSRTLVFYVRGQRGGEKVTIILKDIDNRSVRLRDVYLSSDWREESIPLNISGSHVDLANISSMRIEYGRIGESSSERDSAIESIIYVKDLNLLREAKNS